ncbi:MAG: ATP synthase subunit I [Clostridium sp.]|nr:ATP synthase subunit I [Acetatifactor muris]MCM1525850.1 ATP synthase subunit I [Bacteroides sp.]MCM1562610.1 ATP synthase subunit I [Clostridium sp.]
MKIIETLRNRNRTLLEVNTGVLFWTLAATAAGLPVNWTNWGMSRWDWCAAVWTAGILSVISLLHMYRCLDRALDFDEGTASKLIVRGYLIRYVAFGLILIITVLTNILNPLILCLGYLLIMKVAVYSQPFTHKLYNGLFHEADPEPEPLAEEPLEPESLNNLNQ